MALHTDRKTETLPRPRSAEVTTLAPGRIVVQVNDDRGACTLEVEGSRIIVGAHPSNGISVLDPAVSNLHCELHVKDGGVSLHDLGSKNGTWLDAVQIQEAWVPLGHGFRIGRSTLTLRSVESVEVPVSTLGRFGELRGRGSEMGKLFARLGRLAATALDVLVIGETGTGKELIARGLHDQSDRCEGPFVVVDCTNLSESLAEGILFGHCKGSFTGASTDQAGLLEHADGGTLFLDEIGELPHELQPKLLRVLQQRETRRIGEVSFRPLNTRVIAATNQDVLSMVCKGRFRSDLYFRFGSMTVHVPPLRARGDGDITCLADFFLQECARERGVPLRLDESAYLALTRYEWPGNVRELQGVIRGAGQLAEREVITASDLPMLEVALSPDRSRKAERQRELGEQCEKAMDLDWSEARPVLGQIYAHRALMQADGNQTKAAKQAGMSRSAFRDLMRRPSEGSGRD